MIYIIKDGTVEVTKDIVISQKVIKDVKSIDNIQDIRKLNKIENL